MSPFRALPTITDDVLGAVRIFTRFAVILTYFAWAKLVHGRRPARRQTASHRKILQDLIYIYLPEPKKRGHFPQLRP